MATSKPPRAARPKWLQMTFWGAVAIGSCYHGSGLTATLVLLAFFPVGPYLIGIHWNLTKHQILLDAKVEIIEAGDAEIPPEFDEAVNRTAEALRPHRFASRGLHRIVMTPPGNGIRRLP